MFISVVKLAEHVAAYMDDVFKEMDYSVKFWQNFVNVVYCL